MYQLTGAVNRHRQTWSWACRAPVTEERQSLISQRDHTGLSRYHDAQIGEETIYILFPTKREELAFQLWFSRKSIQRWFCFSNKLLRYTILFWFWGLDWNPHYHFWNKSRRKDPWSSESLALLAGNQQSTSSFHKGQNLSNQGERTALDFEIRPSI